MDINTMDPFDSARLYITCLASIIFYDYLSTIGLEVRFIWKPLFIRNKEGKRRTSLNGLQALFFFVIVRYVALVIFAIQVAGLFMIWSPEKCKSVVAFQSYASVLVNMAATSLLSFRVSAIWARNKGITFVLGLIILVQAICLFYVSSQTKPLETGFCVGGSDQTPVLYLYWSSPMICDLALIGLTLSRAWTLKRKNIKQRTVQLIIKAGLFYCVGTFFCNLMSATLDVKNGRQFKPITVTLALLGTSIICCRTCFSMAKHTFKLAEQLQSDINDKVNAERNGSGSGRIGKITNSEGSSNSPIWKDDEEEEKELDWRERRLRISVQKDPGYGNLNENSTSILRRSISNAARPVSRGSVSSRSNSVRSSVHSQIQTFESNGSRGSYGSQKSTPTNLYIKSSDGRIKSSETFDSFKLYSTQSVEENESLRETRIEMVESESERHSSLTHDPRFGNDLSISSNHDSSRSQRRGGNSASRSRSSQHATFTGRRTVRPKTAPNHFFTSRAQPKDSISRDSSSQRSKGTKVSHSRSHSQVLNRNSTSTTASISTSRATHSHSHSRSCSRDRQEDGLSLQLNIPEPSSSSNLDSHSTSNSRSWLSSSDMIQPPTPSVDERGHRNGHYRGDSYGSSPAYF